VNYPIRCVSVFLFAAAGLALRAADAPSASELLKLEGPALFKAANDVSLFDNPPTTDQLVAIAAKLGDGLKSLPRDDPDHDQYAFTHFFEEACGKAKDRQLDKLIQVYHQMDQTSLEK
jgi:hypothetical protein